jgi:hypothetical protein
VLQHCVWVQGRIVPIKAPAAGIRRDFDFADGGHRAVRVFDQTRARRWEHDVGYAVAVQINVQVAGVGLIALLLRR